MRRRGLILGAGGLTGAVQVPAASGPTRRVRPVDPEWPGEAAWAALGRRLGGRLLRPRSPFEGAIRVEPGRARNPYFLGEEPALTQTSGWADAWRSTPSAWAVAAQDATDVAAAVDFAREHRLRLVVKGGGHSYQGTSCAPASLLVWTRRMDRIALHDAFLPQGCEDRQAPRPAVSLGAGVIWQRAYEAVTVEGGRYVQGGGCSTVGVAGLVQSGGFGSFSKRYGLAAASLLEAEVVTADGVVRTANPCREPELFWALKGGGGGTFGVVTRLTLATHDLPESFGGVFAIIRAGSDTAFRRLIERFLGFYAEALCNPHWGEQLRVLPDNRLAIGMVFQDLDQAEAERRWQPFRDWLAGSPGDYTLAEPFRVLALPARRFWDPAWLRRTIPGMVVADDRPGAPEGNLFWAGDAGQVGWFLHGYESAWLPASLLAAEALPRLAEALFAASRHRSVSLHMNKGLAGAPPAALEAARDTAIHPSALDAFALAISAAAGPPAFAGLPGPGPDLPAARRDREQVAAAMAEVRRLAPEAGSYVAETDFFRPDWQQAFWGPHYPRLLVVKRRYDPDGLFVVHHGVGSEDWSADGFSRAG